jgi:hypothetical protein
MALPLLINNADCGPSNPLQSISKRFDQDRGIQQVIGFENNLWRLLIVWQRITLVLVAQAL